MRFLLFVFAFLSSLNATASSLPAPECSVNGPVNGPPSCLGIGGKPAMVKPEAATGSKNVLGQALQVCGLNPVTGFYRDGSCRTGPEDQALHTVCAVLTADFLLFTKSQGNDLSTPAPQWGFPGLKSGQHWCLCAARWLEAKNAGKAPPVVIEATQEKTLDLISLQLLKVKSARRN